MKFNQSEAKFSEIEVGAFSNLTLEFDDRNQARVKWLKRWHEHSL